MTFLPHVVIFHHSDILTFVGYDKHFPYWLYLAISCQRASGTLGEDVFRKPEKLVHLGLMTFWASVWKASRYWATTMGANNLSAILFLS